MTKDIAIYQIDAFTDRAFGGNPAAVCPLEDWLDEKTMQAIAAENNLSETAFFVPEGEDYRIRWFTPTLEVDLCGHATLASGHVVLKHLRPSAESIRFQSKSGPLSVKRSGDSLTLDFPSQPPLPLEGLEEIEAIVGKKIIELRCAPKTTGKTLAVLESEAAVRSAEPDLQKVAALPRGGLLITARGETVDFVSRYFFPKGGIPEDPVTGSAHTVLAPYWGSVLGKDEMTALQVSPRLGKLKVKLEGERVLISGKTVEYLQGKIFL